MTIPNDDIDPSILDDFRKESKQLLAELTELVERLEESAGDFPAELLKEFSQKIDRIMGAAKTIGMMAPSALAFQKIGKLAELCKALGYNAAGSQAVVLLPFFAAFWSDTIEVIENLVDNIADEAKVSQINQRFSGVLQKRLEWLSGRVASVKSSAAAAAGMELQSLARKLGL
jgi:chemotaxis protein histidine kinase CheA